MEIEALIEQQMNVKLALQEINTNWQALLSKREPNEIDIISYHTQIIEQIKKVDDDGLKEYLFDSINEFSEIMSFDELKRKVNQEPIKYIEQYGGSLQDLYLTDTPINLIIGANREYVVFDQEYITDILETLQDVHYIDHLKKEQ